MPPKHVSTLSADDDFVGQALLDALESGTPATRDVAHSRWKGDWSPSKAEQYEEPHSERSVIPPWRRRNFGQRTSLIAPSRQQQSRQSSLQSKWVKQRHASAHPSVLSAITDNYRVDKRRRWEGQQHGIDITKVDSRSSSVSSPQSLYDTWSGVSLTPPFLPGSLSDGHLPWNGALHQPMGQPTITPASSFSWHPQPTPYAFPQSFQSNWRPHLQAQAPVWLQPLQNLVCRYQTQAHGTETQPILVDSSEEEPASQATGNASRSAGHNAGYPRSSRPLDPSVTPWIPVEGSAQHPIEIDGINSLSDHLTALNVRKGISEDENSQERTTTKERPLKAPEPTSQYLELCSIPSHLLLNGRQRLLVVLDLNGTLLARTNYKSSFMPRNNLKPFLKYLLEHHAVMVWSSSMPHNVHAMLTQLLTRTQRHKLVAVWGRDTLRLNRAQFKSKVQVYKQLSWVWAEDVIAAQHPDFTKSGKRWDQTNTVLIDDSQLKALAEPWNLVEIPEFLKTAQNAQENDVLGQVLGYIDWLSQYDNASAVIKAKPFMVDTEWGWSWEGE